MDIFARGQDNAIWHTAAENGQFVTTKFFGMKANHYLHKHGIPQETLAKVAAKNFRNGALNPNAWRHSSCSSRRPAIPSFRNAL